MRILTGLFLLPGEYVLHLTGIEGEDHRATIRMLVNTLVWTFLGILVVALAI